jgi:hypothetical protein
MSLKSSDIFLFRHTVEIMLKRYKTAQQHPVIRLDMGDVNNTLSMDLEDDLSAIIAGIAQNYQITLSRKFAGGFAELIEKLHLSTGQQMVILIDEYDKPIIDNLSNPEVMNENRKILHNFF